jgi:hypothetical protein
MRRRRGGILSRTRFNQIVDRPGAIDEVDESLPGNTTTAESGELPIGRSDTRTTSIATDRDWRNQAAKVMSRAPRLRSQNATRADLYSYKGYKAWMLKIRSASHDKRNVSGANSCTNSRRDRRA